MICTRVFLVLFMFFKVERCSAIDRVPSAKDVKSSEEDLQTFDLIHTNYTLKSEDWLIYLNGVEIQDKWQHQTLFLSGEDENWPNFLVTKQTLPLKDLLFPHDNWTIDVLFHITHNGIYDKNQASSELKVLLLANDYPWLNQPATADRFSNISGLGIYAIKSISKENITMITFTIQDNLFSWSGVPEVQMTCTLHLLPDYAADFDLPIVFKKIDSLLAAKIKMIEEQGCTLYTHLPRIKIERADHLMPFRIAIGANFHQAERAELIRMSFCSSNNKTFRGVIAGTERDEIDLMDDYMIGSENIDSLEDTLETVVDDMNNMQTNVTADVVITTYDSKMVAVFDPHFEPFSYQPPNFRSEDWKLFRNAIFADKERTLYLRYGIGPGKITAKHALPSEMFRPNFSWQLDAVFEANTTIDENDDFLQFGFCTKQSLTDIRQKFQPKQQGLVTGAIVEIVTTSLKFVGTKHAEEVRLYYGHNFTIVKCAELTTTGLRTRSVRLTFKYHRNILKVEFESVWYGGSEKYSCTKQLYAADFDQAVEGSTDSLYIAAQATVNNQGTESDSIKLAMLRMSRLIDSPKEGAPAFISGNDDESDVSVFWCEANSDAECELDCSTPWVEPSPITLWYRYAGMSELAEDYYDGDDVNDEWLKPVSFANGLTRFSLSRLAETMNETKDTLIGAKFVCVVSNALGRIQRTFTIVDPLSAKEQPPQPFLWGNRIGMFCIDFALTIVGIATLWSCVRLGMILRMKTATCWGAIVRLRRRNKQLDESILRLDDDGLETL